MDYRTTGILPIASRRKVVAHAAEYLVEHCGAKISSYEKISMSKALLELFPILQCNQKNVQPYVRNTIQIAIKQQLIFQIFQHTIYNSVAGGFLGQKLKNMGIVKKRVPKRKSTENVQTPLCEKNQMKTLMNDLKSAVVNELNMDDIKQKLVETMSYRDKLMANKRTDVKEMFSVFYAHPELVNIKLIFSKVGF